MRTLIIPLALSMGLLAALTACGGGGGGPTSLPPPEPPAPVEPPTEPPTEPPAEPPEDIVPPPVAPPRPQGVEVHTGIEIVMLWWDNPHSHYDDHGLTRVYRNTVDDFATAREIGTATGISYVDDTARGGQTYYYWLVWESESGVRSALWASSGNAPRENPRDLITRESDRILNDPLTWELTDVFWRTSGWAGNNRIFSVIIYDDARSVIEGIKSGSNPVRGSATWSGSIGAYERSGKPTGLVTGAAQFRMNFQDIALDADFTDFSNGHADMSWRNLSVNRGSFQDDYSIFGSFYGSGHEGIAGRFGSETLKGAFGAVRE